MRYGSVCSGIEAATVAWKPLGWKAQWFSEVDKFPSEVLKHHYPKVTNYGDMTKFKEWNDGKTIDLLVGGTPCQSFSIAGLRTGLDDPRGNLMLTYLAMAEQLKPKWLVWENVPGVLSSNGGRDFATLLTGLGKIGYGFAYRVLDAQYFGVAQRRRRVFLVGHLGDWRRAASVLFDTESLSGNPPPSREKEQDTAIKVERGTARMRGFGDYTCDDSASTIKSRDYKDATDLVINSSYALPGNWIGRKPENGGNQVQPFFDLSPCQTATDRHAVVYECHGQDSRIKELPEVCSTISAKYGTGGGNQPIVVRPQYAVRRMTPIECERLQGFPDTYTQIPWRNKEPIDCPNGHRYKALGNSMAVPVMNWIGRRISDNTTTEKTK